MELFVASYDDQVVGSGIPISSGRAGVIEDNGGPISFYVRKKCASGVTAFAWFHTNDGALQYIEFEKNAGETVHHLMATNLFVLLVLINCHGENTNALIDLRRQFSTPHRVLF